MKPFLVYSDGPSTVSTACTSFNIAAPKRLGVTQVSPGQVLPTVNAIQHEIRSRPSSTIITRLVKSQRGQVQGVWCSRQCPAWAHLHFSAGSRGDASASISRKSRDAHPADEDDAIFAPTLAGPEASWVYPVDLLLPVSSSPSQPRRRI
jgi:hypothetical protein